MFHTKEHRKETASNSYIKIGSAHPSHTFKGIIKSQMYRLRRLCSKDRDFLLAIDNLKSRCINSGYDIEIINGILDQAKNLKRSLVSKGKSNDDRKKIIRWVILSGTFYEKLALNFAYNLNNYLQNYNIKLEVVKSTGSNIGNLLFNNCEKYLQTCENKKCSICIGNNRSVNYEVISKITSLRYKVDKNITCHDCGIYRITCPCSAAYTGKTTTSFNQRFKEHFQHKRDSSIKDHAQQLHLGQIKDDYKIQFLERLSCRGKYTLSEREYLWNERLGD